MVRALFLDEVVAEFRNFDLVLVNVKLQCFCLAGVRDVLHAQVWIVVFPPLIDQITWTLLANRIIIVLLVFGLFVWFKFMHHLRVGMPLLDFFYLVELDLFLSLNHDVLSKHHLLCFMFVAFLKINCLVFYHKLGMMEDRLQFFVSLFEIRDEVLTLRLNILRVQSIRMVWLLTIWRFYLVRFKSKRRIL